MIALRVGERLKTLRGLRTQAEFAAALGLNQVQYNRYETGKRLAPDRVLERVGQECGLRPEEVVWGPAAEAGLAPDETGEAVAALVRLLDPESLTDLYFFLKRKTEDLALRRQLEAKQAHSALEVLRRRSA